MHKPLLAASGLLCCYPVLAQELPGTLDIVITAGRGETLIREAPGSISVISRHELEQQGGDNVQEVLQGTPGITLQGLGSGGRKTISLRGLESRHTLIMIDGRRIPASNDSIGPNTDYQYDWIPLEQIERIEVVRGPLSVLYGSDALGGAINIITRRPAARPHADLMLGSRSTAGSEGGDGHELRFNIGGGIGEQVRIGLSGQQSRRSALESRLTPGTSALEGREKQQLGLQLDWNWGEGQHLKLEHTDVQEQRWQDAVTRTGTAYQSRYDINRTQTSLGWEGRLGDIETRARAYQGQIDITNRATQGVTPTSPQTLDEQVLEAGAVFTPDAQARHRINTGLEYRRETLEHPNLDSSEDSVDTRAAFVQDTVRLGQNTRLTAGIRWDDHAVFGAETSPRIAVSHDLNEKLTLKASYGHGFHAPNIKQTAPGYSFQSGPFLIRSNPDLKPESNKALELGFHFGADLLTLDAALFRNAVDDLIDTRFNQLLDNGLQEWRYDNIHSATLQGLEVATRTKLTPALHLKGSYQYLDARDGDDIRLERRPRHTLSAGLEWNFGGWDSSLRAEHVADQLIIPPASNTLTALPDYTLWHAAFSRPLGKGLNLRLGINNLTDVRLEDKSPDFRHEEYPRTVRVELNGSF
ncbi:MAG TPA: TonB-dependent receptor [Thiolinea sp.]|nr:TonB-dependent receptor [Thiolinea sp.]